MIKRLFIILAILTLAILNLSYAAENNNDSYKNAFNILINNYGESEQSNLPNPVIKLVKLYQKHISPINGPVCMFKPSCSQFFLDAYKNYGLFWSILMTTDRMIYRENRASMKYYEYDKKTRKYLDPVHNNYIFGKWGK